MSWCAVLPAVLFAACASAQQIGISLERIDSAFFTASGITGVLRAATAGSATTTTLELRAAEVSFAGQTWRGVAIACPDLKQERDELICAQGALAIPAKVPLSFRFSMRSKNLELVLRPAANEEWHFTVSGPAAARTVALTVRNGVLTRFKAWWPKDWPAPNAGTVSGKLTFSDEPEPRIAGELALANFGFADASGAHAGEKINADWSLAAQQRGAQWRWQSRLDWKSGDVYWQPLFVSGGGHSFDAAGTLDERQLAIEQGRLTLAGIAAVDLSAAFDRTTGKLTVANLKSTNVDIAALYSKLLKPALQGTVLADLRCEGRADFALTIKDGEVTAADAAFRRVAVEDNGRRFALFGLDGQLPWHHEEVRTAKLHVTGGEVLRVPFGAFDLPVETRGLRVRVRDAEIPVLDGRLSIVDFVTSGERESWRWRFTGALKPVSVAQLTTALGLPAMHGTLAATIPVVRYQDSTLIVDGALTFNLFDGTINVRNLALEDPLGKVPRLTGDIDMRNLDLDLLTRTFSFGKITGRVDAEFKALELVNWQAVRFEARVGSSPGDYPRRISQAAVQNISALGGAGAAAAIQRSFLRFFETFGYSALGWSCRLELEVCHMGGIENVPQGYVIVKGGGIPAITVLGYNRMVGWRELLARLQRVSEGNVIVK